MEEHATALVDAIAAALPAWVERSVERILVAWQGRGPDEAARSAAAVAGEAAVADVVPRLRVLLEADVDEQRTTPLAIVRDAVRYPTAVLRAAGVPPVERDAFAVHAFPDDHYDLTPASFADLDPSVAEPGIIWGAMKAREHMRRHKT